MFLVLFIIVQAYVQATGAEQTDKKEETHYALLEVLAVLTDLRGSRFDRFDDFLQFFVAVYVAVSILE